MAFQSVTEELQAHPQMMVERDAVCHLMRVAAGLESLVIGETEILRQIGDALRQAQEAGTTGAALSRLFHDAIHAGKRARTETAISQHTLSVSHAAVMLAQREFPEMRGVSALVVGAGRMAELAIRALKAHGAGCVRVMNRTDSRASALAIRTGIEAVEGKHLNAALRQADVVVTATSAPRPILSAETLARRGGRRGLMVIDIGVPRNVEDSAGMLPGVRLYDIDDLQQVVADHRARRQEEAARVETIIAQEAQRYLDWLKSRSAVPTIVALRQKADSVAALEVERALNRLPDLSEHEREVVTQMAQRIVNKLLHAPTAALREQSAPADDDDLVRQLFDLEAER